MAVPLMLIVKVTVDHLESNSALSEFLAARHEKKRAADG